MSKRKSNTFLTVIAGTAAIASIGVGAFYIMNFFSKTSTHHYTYYNSETKELNFGVELTNNPVKQGSDEFFLSNKGIGKLKDKINTCLEYGPEFTELSGIFIDDENRMKGGEASGAYVPATDDIVISTQDWIDDGFKTVKKGEFNDKQEDAKIELVFQVLFHEYGHFLANRYINSEIDTNLTTTLHSYQAQDEGKADLFAKARWNTDFLNSFTHLLNYDSTQLVKKDGTLTASGYFQNLNETNQDALNGNIKEIKTYDKYYYSIDELFTRKFQLMTMPLIGETKGSAHLVNDSWYTMPSFKNYNHATPYGQDMFKIFNYHTRQQIMSDNPFAQQGELFNLLGDYFGFNTIDSVSDIYFHDGKIKVGGYTDDLNTKLLIDGQEYVDTKTHKVQYHMNSGPSPIVSRTKYSNAKTIRSAKDFWIADDIPVDRIEGKSLSLLINGEVVPLTIKDHKYGSVSTDRFYLNPNVNSKGKDEDIRNRFSKNPYEVIKDANGQITVEKEGES